MIRAKKLIRIARKWCKLSSVGRKRIYILRSDDADHVNSSPCNPSSTVAKRGHFVVYTIDEKRFEMPLAYLYTNIFQELFKMSEEEFGLSSSRPITLPCDVFMSHVVLHIQRGATKDIEKALINSINISRCSLAPDRCTSEQLLVCGF
ncbi:auxin-responsive protein SAUR64-like [Carya illinoinensis]|uniref:Uncharacterized protein n=1 Tax=Carya illinoinensis TaxID=32201 RepID=A0A8T1QHC3_CARIL|nr:auxin-responsive protein SAUR64-like [Carya illinoinensis]KAG6653594.1 hypothetical protein CIPAW_05G088500 [Carya illinoinensis]